MVKPVKSIRLSNAKLMSLSLPLASALSIWCRYKGLCVINMPIQLMPNEESIEVIRRHPVYVMTNISIPLVALLVSLYVIFVFDPDIGIIGSLFEFAFAIVGILALLAIAQFAYRYWFDVWIITTQRLIDSVRNHPFHQNVKSMDLGKVQDISISRSGVLATILNTGDVRCRTASTDSNFIICSVSNPGKIMDTINLAISKKRIP
jgi:hypothetical protein